VPQVLQPAADEQPRRKTRYDLPRDSTEKPQPQPPDEQTQSVQFDEGLQDIADAFADGNYSEAAQQAGEALNSDPDNEFLPFLYSQSLFADQRYAAAASVLRQALTEADIDEDAVYYSTGFYRDQQTLVQQIDDLIRTAGADPSNAGLQLVLGYQLLGVGRYDEAVEALETAGQDYVNRRAATALIEIFEKSRQDTGSESESGTDQSRSDY
jgi:thioredoxin-like negative regulator of GroEL